MNNENEEYRQKLNEIIIAKRQEDSIYEISENEMNNDIEIESDNEFYNITND